jgi:uncharacterized Zn finger protein
MKAHRRCPYCNKVREVIIEGNKYLCKHCGRVHSEIKHSLNNLLI